MSQFLDLYPEPDVTPVPPPPVPLQGTATTYSRGFGKTHKAWLAEVNNPWRKVGVVAAYGFFFLRFTDLHTIIAAKTGFPNYLLYLFAVPALVGLVASGGVGRAFRLKSGWYLLAFLTTMTVAAIGSSWPGGSLIFIWSYFRSNWISFVLLAGLLMTYRELWRMLQLIAVCAAVNILIASLLNKSFENISRAGTELGTYSNPNDFAAVLTLVLPFLGLVVCAPKAKIIARVLALMFLPWGLYKHSHFGVSWRPGRGDHRHDIPHCETSASAQGSGCLGLFVDWRNFDSCDTKGDCRASYDLEHWYGRGRRRINGSA